MRPVRSQVVATPSPVAASAIPMSTLASKGPALKFTGNRAFDDVAKAQRDRFIDAISITAAAPNLENMAVRRLREDWASEQVAKTAHGMDTWAEVGTLGTVDEVWMAEWNASKISVPVQDLKRAKDYDSGSIKHIYGSWVAMMSSKYPDECLIHTVLNEVSDERLAAFGNRHRLIENQDEQFINPDGSIDWTRGVYEIEFDDSTGKTKKLIHRPTGHSVPFDEDTTVDSRFDINSNSPDTQAAVCKGRAADEFIKNEEATKTETKAHEKASLGDLESNPESIKAMGGDVISGNFDMEAMRDHKRQEVEASGTSSSSSWPS